MRAVVGVLYWLAVGMLTLFAFYVSVAGNSLWSGLLIPAALALLGAVLLFRWPRYGGA
jgi:hypothetical protein